MSAFTHRAALFCLALLAFASMAGVFVSVSAAEEPTARPQIGEILYRVHCLNCHGADGKGRGPLALVLTIEPSNLTLLSQNDGGVFPTERVAAVIDGREQVRAHGKRDMPVWGLSFQDRSRDSDQEEDVQQKIRDLVAYLKSIQVAAPAAAD